MEVWNLLKDHIEMTVELKLEQLYNMITTVYRYREEPHTEFKELLSSLPLESVTLFNCLKWNINANNLCILDIAMSNYTMGIHLQYKVIETPAKINSGETFPHDSDG